MLIIKSLIVFFNTLYTNKSVLINLIRRDFNSQYIGSAFGFVWTFLQPLAFITVIWFVFTYAMKSGDVDGVPFAIFMLSGFSIWNFFSDSFVKGTSSISEYSFLVKKVQFPIALIPVVKIGSTLMTHAIFLILLFIILIANGYNPSFYWFQSIFYIFASIALSLGLVWLCSALNVFFKDTAQIVTVLLQIGVWATPVFWNIKMFPENIQAILLQNPLAYIVNGYRNTFINHIPFWEQSGAFGFWITTIIMILIGAFVFQKLRPHFADVL